MVRQSDYKNTDTSRSPRGRRVSVQEANTLLPFLLELLKEQSRTSVKALLAHGHIAVNGNVTSQFNTPLVPGDEVLISSKRGNISFNNPLLNIIWEDDDLIVINKKEGLLAYHLLSNYVKKIDPRNKIFVLHRLDRDTSGLMMFAKNQQVQKALQSDWNSAITRRTYVAVVEGRPAKDSDLLVSNLVENKQMQVYVTNAGDGKQAITRYRLLRSNEAYSLLELELETGRKNQIRAQMQSIGHSIAGDYKYGAETDPTGRLMLHAQRLYFIHPATGKEMRFETRIPDKFISLTQ